MLSREEYERITEEASTWAKAANDAVRHERGGTRLSEMRDAPDPELSDEQEREYREKAWRRELYYARQELALNLGEEGPDGFEDGSWLGLWSPSNYLDPTGGGYQQHDPDRTPEGVARLAAGEFTERKLKARIERFRETARLCDALADSMENRLTEERAGLRRIR